MPLGICELLMTSSSSAFGPPQRGPTQLQPMNMEDSHGVLSLTVELFGNYQQLEVRNVSNSVVYPLENPSELHGQ